MALMYAEIHGFNINAKWIGNDEFLNSGKMKINDATFSAEDIKRNTGKGKFFPSWPICEYMANMLIDLQQLFPVSNDLPPDHPLWESNKIPS